MSEGVLCVCGGLSVFAGWLLIFESLQVYRIDDLSSWKVVIALKRC